MSRNLESRRGGKRCFDPELQYLCRIKWCVKFLKCSSGCEVESPINPSLLADLRWMDCVEEIQAPHGANMNSMDWKAIRQALEALVIMMRLGCGLDYAGTLTLISWAIMGLPKSLAFLAQMAWSIILPRLSYSLTAC